MAGLARYALPGIIVLTSVGAFLMCLLVIRYGFGAREIELDDDEARRLFMVRIGHAVAAVCFAGAALLAVVALPALTRPPAAPPAAQSAPPPSAAVPPAALDEQAQEIARLRDALHQTQLEIEDKFSAIDSRVTNLAAKAPAAPPTVERPPSTTAPSSRSRPSRAEAPTATARRDLGDEVAALPSGATAHQFRARVQGFSVDVQTRPLRDNQTAYYVRLLDAGNRPVSADVMLVGTRADGTPVIATLQPTNEPGVHSGRVATPGEGADLRLRVVAANTRFEVSLARDVNW